MVGELSSCQPELRVCNCTREYLKLKVVPDSTEQSTVTLLLQRLDSLLGQGGARPLEGVPTGIEVDEGELEVQRGGESLQDPSTGLELSVSAAILHHLVKVTAMHELSVHTGMTSRPIPSPGIRPARDQQLSCKYTLSPKKGCRRAIDLSAGFWQPWCPRCWRVCWSEHARRRGCFSRGCGTTLIRGHGEAFRGRVKT